MATLDVESLLQPLSDDAPSGENLEYDPTYAAFEQAAREKPEQQYGATIIPAEPPNWLDVRQLGMDLVTRTKDLRVACTLALGLLETEGLPAFTDGLALVRGYVERFWSTVHPQLDPDDDNDPTLRVNTISFLTDQATTVKSLRTTPIVSARLVGRFSLRDVDIANGEIPPATGEEPIKSSTIDAAFSECDLEELRTNTNAARDGLEHIEAIESVITQQVGASRAVSLELLRHTLRDVYVVLEQNLERRDMAAGVPGVAAATGADGAPAPSAGRLTGEIQSREDVIKALEKICQYYARHEPSSPLPLLLTRAKRLASKSFLEIVQDLTPDAMAQIQALAGTDNDGSGG
ncbi:MAG TPA: type VI secretion system protein TssA [Lacipirellulaceae bacterium]|nr:type VI secretion system protein TssA [Lacipirellulaceae bacterium]